MLTSVNDFLSLAVLIALCIFTLRLLFASFKGFEDNDHKKTSVFYDYSDNEEE